MNKSLPAIIAIIAFAVIALIVFNVQVPNEAIGLLCIIIPSSITGMIGYIIGKRGRPSVRIEFQADAQPACAACGHSHKDDACKECECQAFVE